MPICISFCYIVLSILWLPKIVYKTEKGRPSIYYPHSVYFTQYGHCRWRRGLAGGGGKKGGGGGLYYENGCCGVKNCSKLTTWRLFVFCASVFYRFKCLAPFFYRLVLEEVGCCLRSLDPLFLFSPPLHENRATMINFPCASLAIYTTRETRTFHPPDKIISGTYRTFTPPLSLLTTPSLPSIYIYIYISTSHLPYTSSELSEIKPKPN